MKIAIIEDNYEEFKLLEDYLQTFFANRCMKLSLEIIFYQDEMKFLAKFIPNEYDFVFIDYFLKNLTGLEIARRIRKQDNCVNLIFTTSSRDFAAEGYKVKACGYLIKPIIYEELQEIMELIDYKKIREQRYIEISSKGENVKILVRDIVYCDIDGHYTQIHMNNLQIQKSRITFSEFQEMLFPYPEFLSCYRGCIVNMMQIKTVGDLVFIMSNEEQVPFRKKHKVDILKKYSEFLFEAARGDRL